MQLGTPSEHYWAGYFLSQLEARLDRLPEMPDLELQAKVNSNHCCITTILMTADCQTNLRMRALLTAATECLKCHSKIEVLLLNVRATLEG